jgi:hypothetical protein
MEVQDVGYIQMNVAFGWRLSAENDEIKLYRQYKKQIFSAIKSGKKTKTYTNPEELNYILFISPKL